MKMRTKKKSGFAYCNWQKIAITTVTTTTKKHVHKHTLYSILHCTVYTKSGRERKKEPITQHRHMKINLHFVCTISTAMGIRNNRNSFDIENTHSTLLHRTVGTHCKSSKVCQQMAINHTATAELSWAELCVLYFVFNWISRIFRCARFIRFYALQLSVHPQCGFHTV